MNVGCETEDIVAWGKPPDVYFLFRWPETCAAWALLCDQGCDEICSDQRCQMRGEHVIGTHR